MSEKTNSNSAREESSQNNILANELKSEANPGSTTTNIPTRDTDYPEGSKNKEETLPNNILANELKSEADDKPTTNK